MVNRTKPNAFIVGAPKCGTTGMHTFLESHPDICVALYKEVLYFGSDLFSDRTSREYKTEEWYLNLFSHCQDRKIILESSVWYFYSQQAPSEIHNFSPDARIIIMLRNPVERLYSHYYQLLYNGHENIKSFEAALAAEPERKAGKKSSSSDALTRRLYYRENAHYTPYVRAYLQEFGREKVHIIIHDDMVADVARVYRETLEFLDVDPEFAPEFTSVNANKYIRSSFVRDFFRKPPAWLTTPARQIIPAKTRAKINRQMIPAVRRLNTRYDKRPPLDAALRKQLQQECLADIEQLSELLERDLTHWCQS